VWTLVQWTFATDSRQEWPPEPLKRGISSFAHPFSTPMFRMTRRSLLLYSNRLKRAFVKATGVTAQQRYLLIIFEGYVLDCTLP